MRHGLIQILRYGISMLRLKLLNDKYIYKMSSDPFAFIWLKLVDRSDMLDIEVSRHAYRD